MSCKLKCIACGKEYPYDPLLATCPDHDPHYGYLQVVSETPLFTDVAVDIGQVKTPLIQATTFGAAVGIPHLSVKDEAKNPTGSFKDRESFVLFNTLAALGNTEPVYVVSSGNAAVSTAAYANKAGVPCTCYVPKKTSNGKKRLITLYGATIVEMDGSYEDIYQKLIADPPAGINATPGLCPTKEEGPKRIAHEIVEQMGAPDVVVVPCGNGTNLWSIYSGFVELQKAGTISSVPKMIGVQIAGGDPIAQAIAQGKESVELADAPDSVAEGIIATASYASPKAVKAILASGGSVISVTDDEVLAAHHAIIAAESLLPEITSSAVFAALKKMDVAPDEKVVCISTGTGLKEVNGFS